MLGDELKKTLRDRYEKLRAEGTVPSPMQIDQFCTTFRTKFGPDVIAGLDGEPLLKSLHETGSKDSLSYWLEFKNDDEFPSIRFGSIAGGSALKFGVYLRKETGIWQAAGKGNYPKDISLDEAIAMARKHKEQLLRGIEVLDRLPTSGRDEDYRQLQVTMDQVAPEVGNLSWGHKYFYLLYPDKLDDFHNPDMQRYYLLKLLQSPPEGDGRYLCAGRYVSAARECEMQVNALTAVLYTLFPKHRYWRIGTSNGEKPRNRWELMRDGNCVAIGWPEIGDLSSLENSKAGREELQSLLTRHYPTRPQGIGKARTQIFNFLTTLAVGDIVLAADGGTVIGIGRITGDYAYDPSHDFPHVRTVEWLSLDEWKMPEPEGLQTTLYEIWKHPNILAVEHRVQGHPTIVVSEKAIPTGAMPRLTGIMGRIQSILDRKAQVIVYGPPGTGKTYWAEKAACELAALSTFGVPFGELAEQEKSTVLGTDKAAGLVRICCFHPAYGYEDFMEGYRPDTVNGNVTFTLRDGVFKQICQAAAASPQRRFFLIVDEINRGDIPRIFGELLTVLERDKRGKGIVLPVSREVFRVPPNVFVIGTMNTADRSISLLDAALRRRFGFVELMPDSSVLKDHSVEGIPLAPWFDALNRRICEHVGRDAKNLQIGHSYLLHGGRPLKDFAALRRALRDDIIPLLEEYCYDDAAALQNILGTALIDMERKCIRYELFDEGREVDLVQALLQPCPEILTSAEALAAEKDMEDDLADDDEENCQP